MYTPTEQRHIPKAPSYRRLSAARQGYGRRWQEARKHFLRNNPLCVVCKREGVTTLATHVDHIKPHRGDMKLFWNRNNWQPLCASCHSNKTNMQDGGFGNITAVAKAIFNKKYKAFGNIYLGDNNTGGGIQNLKR